MCSCFVFQQIGPTASNLRGKKQTKNKQTNKKTKQNKNQQQQYTSLKQIRYQNVMSNICRPHLPPLYQIPFCQFNAQILMCG